MRISRALFFLSAPKTQTHSTLYFSLSLSFSISLDESVNGDLYTFAHDSLSLPLRRLIIATNNAHPIANAFVGEKTWKRNGAATDELLVSLFWFHYSLDIASMHVLDERRNIRVSTGEKEASRQQPTKNTTRTSVCCTAMQCFQLQQCLSLSLQRVCVCGLASTTPLLFFVVLLCSFLHWRASVISFRVCSCSSSITERGKCFYTGDFGHSSSTYLNLEQCSIEKSRFVSKKWHPILLSMIELATIRFYPSRRPYTHTYSCREGARHDAR